MDGEIGIGGEDADNWQDRARFATPVSVPETLKGSAMALDRMLGDVVNIFSCCIFSWKALTTMAPAFFLAGAVSAFVSSASVVKYLGPTAPKPVAYGTAAVSGVLLSLCSCNVVPLFASIYMCGAGLGPAVTFLYAGPAINILSLIWAVRVIGWRLGLWRAIAVPLIALLSGGLMAALFARSEASRQNRTVHIGEEDGKPVLPLTALIGILLGLLLLGSADELPLLWRLPSAVFFLGALAVVLRRWFSRNDLRLWLGETWRLFKLVIPVLLPAVLLIGIFAKLVPLRWVYAAVGSNSPGSILAAAAFGSLMYFPILTEVPFVKMLLLLGMNAAPGLAILLLAPGLSLPGMLVLRKVIGVRRLAAYVMILIGLAAFTSWIFGVTVADYMCPCMMPDL